MLLYLYYVIKKEMTVREIALRDIGEVVSGMKNVELSHYNNNKEVYTIDYYGQNGGHHKWSRYESYVVPISMLNTKENRRLNKELGI